MVDTPFPHESKKLVWIRSRILNYSTKSPSPSNPTRTYLYAIMLRCYWKGNTGIGLGINWQYKEEKNM